MKVLSCALRSASIILLCFSYANAAVVFGKQSHGSENLAASKPVGQEKSRDSVVKPGPLKVFVLAGQSNMEGQASVDGINRTDPNHGYANGTLKYLIKDNRTKEEFAPTVNQTTGNWTVLDDVWVWFNEKGKTDDGTYGPFSVGYGCMGDPHKFGPEYGFGFAVGDAIAEQVLLVKTAWGGKDLAHDFRPPSSGGTVGPYYQKMLEDVQNVLGNLTHLFPAYNTTAGYEISGFGWFQGWNDGCSEGDVVQYETNMVNLIKDLRNEWKAPNLPVSIPVSGFGGWGQKISRRLGIIQAQFNAANATLHPEINNATHPTVTAEETRGFWRDAKYSPSNRGYHLNFNAETYWYIGKVMGEAMVKMMGLHD